MTDRPYDFQPIEIDRLEALEAEVTRLRAETRRYRVQARRYRAALRTALHLAHGLQPRPPLYTAGAEQKDESTVRVIDTSGYATSADEAEEES